MSQEYPVDPNRVVTGLINIRFALKVDSQNIMGLNFIVFLRVNTSISKVSQIPVACIIEILFLKALVFLFLKNMNIHSIIEEIR